MSRNGSGWRREYASDIMAAHEFVMACAQSARRARTRRSRGGAKIRPFRTRVMYTRELFAATARQYAFVHVTRYAADAGGGGDNTIHAANHVVRIGLNKPPCECSVVQEGAQRQRPESEGEVATGLAQGDWRSVVDAARLLSSSSSHAPVCTRCCVF